MAQKKKTSSPKTKKDTPKKETKVTRIKAEDTQKTKVTKSSVGSKSSNSANKTKVEAKTVASKAKAKTEKAPKNGDGRSYLKGAWYELKQVRWPNRRTTWALTLAVILFTAFFVGLIVLLDYGFQWVFDQLLG